MLSPRKHTEHYTLTKNNQAKTTEHIGPNPNWQQRFALCGWRKKKKKSSDVDFFVPDWSHVANWRNQRLAENFSTVFFVLLWAERTMSRGVAPTSFMLSFYICLSFSSGHSSSLTLHRILNSSLKTSRSHLWIQAKMRRKRKDAVACSSLLSQPTMMKPLVFFQCRCGEPGCSSGGALLSPGAAPVAAVWNYRAEGLQREGRPQQAAQHAWKGFTWNNNAHSCLWVIPLHV